MTPEEYGQLTAHEIVGLVRAGKIKPIEAVEAAIAAIEARNGSLNAVVLLDADRARAAARTIDLKAPLAGVPFLVKDNNQFVDGWPTTYSSRFYEGSAPRPDSEMIRRLKKAGVVLVGKTNTPEFAADWTTEPTLRGPTRNPWNLTHSAGGSSGGSASAVAAGMTPAAHGNDNGGSIRVPAAVCGLFGLKPSRGLVPIGPYFGELAAGLNSEHVLTRSVRDSAVFLDVLAGPEPGGRYPVEKSVPSYLEAIERPLERLTIGLVDQNPSGAPVHWEIAAAIRMVGRLLEAEGHIVEPIPFPDDPVALSEAETIWFAEIAMLVRVRAKELDRAPRNDEIEAITAYAIEATATLDAADFLQAFHEVHAGAVRVLERTARFDLLLTPTTGEPPPLIGELDSRTERFDYAVWSEKSAKFAPFTAIFNITGQPAASFPVALTSDGLPVGVQLVGRPWRDDIVLAVSTRLEQTIGRLSPPTLASRT